MKWFEPEKHKKPGAIAKFILKRFVKPKVVGEKAYQEILLQHHSLSLKEENFDEEKKKTDWLYPENPTTRASALTEKNLILLVS
jgi:uncharacterized protein YjcR